MRDLTKWPRLLVQGENVTQEQAREILIRTTVPAYLSGNDREWNAIVGEVTGFREEVWPEHGTPEAQDPQLRTAWFKRQWEATDVRAQELGIISLNYLYNMRIASTYIGGPYGWCDWDGSIGCSTYNVGKWPSHAEITDEWTRIAAAFPFLDLTAQLIPNEGEDTEPAGQWRVKGGRAVMQAPGELLKGSQVVPSNQVGSSDFLKVLRPFGERGVSRMLLELAVREVEIKMQSTLVKPAVTSTTKEIES